MFVSLELECERWYGGEEKPKVPPEKLDKISSSRIQHHQSICLSLFISMSLRVCICARASVYITSRDTRSKYMYTYYAHSGAQVKRRHRPFTHVGTVSSSLSRSRSVTFTTEEIGKIILHMTNSKWWCRWGQRLLRQRHISTHFQREREVIFKYPPPIRSPCKINMWIERQSKRKREWRGAQYNIPRKKTTTKLGYHKLKQKSFWTRLQTHRFYII